MSDAESLMGGAALLVSIYLIVNVFAPDLTFPSHYSIAVAAYLLLEC